VDEGKPIQKPETRQRKDPDQPPPSRNEPLLETLTNSATLTNINEPEDEIFELTRLIGELEEWRTSQGEKAFLKRIDELLEGNFGLEPVFEGVLQKALVLAIALQDEISNQNLRKVLSPAGRQVARTRFLPPSEQVLTVPVFPREFLFPRLEGDSLLSNGQTAETFRQSSPNCFYCGVELLHSLSVTRVGGKSRVAGQRARLSAIDHVYPNELAIKNGQNILTGVLASPVWWYRYLSDVGGLVVACSRCNGSKGDKLVTDWTPPDGYRAGAQNEAQILFEYVQARYNFRRL
jgi:hypothetical protein